MQYSYGTSTLRNSDPEGFFFFFTDALLLSAIVPDWCHLSLQFSKDDVAWPRNLLGLKLEFGLFFMNDLMAAEWKECWVCIMQANINVNIYKA